MKPKTKAAGLTIVTSLVLGQAGHAALVTGTWTKSQGTGPLTSENTASPVVGNGTSNSADAVGFHSAMPTITLAGIGDKVTLTGTVTLTGLVSGGVRQFRWGLYDLNGSADATGWLGYFATQGSGTTVGELYERNTGNTSSYISGTGVSTTGGSAPGTGISFTDGTYSFSLEIEVVSTGYQVDSSIIRTSDSQNFGSVSLLDTTTQTDTFDRVGFLIGNALDADQATFSNIDVTFVPEPGSTTLGLIGALALLRRRRA